MMLGSFVGALAAVRAASGVSSRAAVKATRTWLVLFIGLIPIDPLVDIRSALGNPDRPTAHCSDAKRRVKAGRFDGSGAV
jgi:hypothetical protein